MNPVLRSHLLCLPFLAFATLLPAQEAGGEKKQGDKPKASAQDDKKDQKGAPKDDPQMAKDPAILAIDKFLKKANVDTKNPAWRTQLKQPPLVPFDSKTEYFWHMETTKGELKIKFFPDTAPMHVTSGIYLARLGFYDGLKFHRVIKGFMAQGGCPNGNGGGGPGYQFDGEFYGTRVHDKAGILSMANTGMPKSDGSQFFLTFKDTAHLDGKHTIWGEVVDGMDTLKAIEESGTEKDGAKMADPPAIVRSWISVKKQADKPKTGEKADKSGAGPKN
jgi:peptidyl-prolyl cis-trans isomerase B (cyclophilin B)